MVADTVSHLQSHMAGFDAQVSDFLMTLQLVHPPNITRIANIDDLKLFRQSLVRSMERSTLSTDSINSFLCIHQEFVDKVSRQHVCIHVIHMYIYWQASTSVLNF